MRKTVYGSLQPGEFLKMHPFVVLVDGAEVAYFSNRLAVRGTVFHHVKLGRVNVAVNDGRTTYTSGEVAQWVS